jgi:hypothetical protein
MHHMAQPSFRIADRAQIVQLPGLPAACTAARHPLGTPVLRLCYPLGLASEHKPPARPRSATDPSPGSAVRPRGRPTALLLLAWPGLACSVWRRGPVRLDAPGRRPCRLLVRARPIRSARALAAGLENPVGDGDLVAGQVGLGAPPCPGRYGAVVAVERRFDVEGMVAPHGAACGYARHRPDPGDQVVARVVGEGGDSVGEGASARLQSARHRATPALREWFDHEASASPSVAKL